MTLAFIGIGNVGLPSPTDYNTTATKSSLSTKTATRIASAKHWCKILIGRFSPYK